jgi:hypothetical protein
MREEQYRERRAEVVEDRANDEERGRWQRRNPAARAGEAIGRPGWLPPQQPAAERAHPGPDRRLMTSPDYAHQRIAIRT